MSRAVVATNAVVAAYRPLLAEIGLTFPQHLLMLVHWQDGDRLVHELADRLALPSHALSPVLHPAAGRRPAHPQPVST